MIILLLLNYLVYSYIITTLYVLCIFLGLGKEKSPKEFYNDCLMFILISPVSFPMMIGIAFKELIGVEK